MVCFSKAIQAIFAGSLIMVLIGPGNSYAKKKSVIVQLPRAVKVCRDQTCSRYHPKGILKKGLKLKVLRRGSNSYLVKTRNGKKYWLSKSVVKEAYYGPGKVAKAAAKRAEYYQKKAEEEKYSFLQSLFKEEFKNMELDWTYLGILLILGTFAAFTNWKKFFTKLDPNNMEVKKGPNLKRIDPLAGERSFKAPSEHLHGRYKGHVNWGHNKIEIGNGETQTEINLSKDIIHQRGKASEDPQTEIEYSPYTKVKAKPKFGVQPPKIGNVSDDKSDSMISIIVDATEVDKEVLKKAKRQLRGLGEITPDDTNKSENDDSEDLDKLGSKKKIS